MKNTFKKLLLCFLAAAAVITEQRGGQGYGRCRKQRRAGQNVSLAAAAKQGYCLRDWQGYIAVFEDGRQTPKTVTDIPTETLNNVDRESSEPASRPARARSFCRCWRILAHKTLDLWACVG